MTSVIVHELKVEKHLSVIYRFAKEGGFCCLLSHLLGSLVNNFGRRFSKILVFLFHEERFNMGS